MEYSPQALAGLIVQAVILGLTLGFFYSVLCVVRILFTAGSTSEAERKLSEICFPLIGKASVARKTRRCGHFFVWILTFFQDILFCLSASVGILLLAFVGNQGRIRWFLLVGSLIGFLLFFKTLGKLIAYFSEWISAGLHVVFRYVWFLLFFPLRALFDVLRKLICNLTEKMERKRRSKRDVAFRKAEMSRLLSAASEGFGCIKLFMENDTNESNESRCTNEKDVKRRNCDGRIKKRRKTRTASAKNAANE